MARLPLPAGQEPAISKLGASSGRRSGQQASQVPSLLGCRALPGTSPAATPAANPLTTTASCSAVCSWSSALNHKEPSAAGVGAPEGYGGRAEGRTGCRRSDRDTSLMLASHELAARRRCVPVMERNFSSKNGVSPFSISSLSSWATVSTVG